MAKKLVWKEEHGFKGWGCSECGFVIPNPRLMDSQSDYVKDCRQRFDRHSCDKHFPQKKSREDVNQAAARIVIESTE